MVRKHDPYVSAVFWGGVGYIGLGGLREDLV